MILPLGQGWVGTGYVCSHGAGTRGFTPTSGVPVGMLEHMGAGGCLPTRSFQWGNCFLFTSLPGASGPKRVKAEMTRALRPWAGRDWYPSGHIPLVKAVTGLAQLQGRGSRLHLLMKTRADSLWHILTHCRHQTVRGFCIYLPGLSPISTVVMWGWRLEGRRGSATRSPHVDSGAERDSQPGLSPAHPLTPCSWRGPPPFPGIAVRDSALHVLVFAIRKFSGPSSVPELVPMKTKSLHL